MTEHGKEERALIRSPTLVIAAIGGAALVAALGACAARADSTVSVVPLPATEAGRAAEAAVAPFAGADAPPLAAPTSIFERIEAAWFAARTESLLVHFGDGKVSLAFRHAGPRGGLFTRTQAAYLFADHFRHTATERFHFVRFRNAEPGAQMPFAVADRVFRLESGLLYHDQVYVSLRREAGAWKIAEIKSIDP